MFSRRSLFSYVSLHMPKGWIWAIILPLIYAATIIAGPWISSPLAIYGGGISQSSGAILPGYATIDPNIGFTSYALGRLASHELLQGHLPVWNYFEGLGLPLVGETQSAALLPFTLLLRLPQGQVIEHALFQIIAGLGVFFLLRELKFKDQTAVTLSISFEFCSLFVWLKNAMINPICFLVWLLVFSNRLIVADHRRSWQYNAIGMGLAAGFAVLGGFPETVYIFIIFLAAWTIFYIVRENPVRNAIWRFGQRVSLALVIAILIGSPLLIGLAAFFPVAVVGSHEAAGNAMAHLSWVAALKYLLPYLSGPIFGYSVQDEIGSIGGYTGVTLFLLAGIGLAAPSRRGERLFWAASIVLCIGASHGAPTIQNAVMTIPGLSLTAFYRQADVVWIICFVLLAAHGMESLPGLTKRRLITAIGAAIAVSALLVRIAGPALAAWAAMPEVRPWLAGSAIAAAVLALAVTFSALLRRQRVIAGLLIAESAILFLLPVLSLPTSSQIDWGLIDFVRGHVGVARVVNFGSNIINPNFGSALGIRQLNYDDLPIPTATARFIHDKLDPFYPQASSIYLPDFPPSKNAASRSAYMAEHIAAYRQAGVKYILTQPDGFGLPSPIRAGTNAPFSLASGESMSMRLSLRTRGDKKPEQTVSGQLSIRVATFGNTSDGELQIRTCRPNRNCETVTVLCQDLEDNEYVSAAEHVFLSTDDWLDLTITKVGGDTPVAVWLYQRADDSSNALSVEDITGSHPGLNDSVPDLRLSLEGTSEIERVYRGRSGDVYELRNPTPYITAEGCTASSITFEKASVNCTGPSILTRLEVWMPGWFAHVDGISTPVIDGFPFQQVSINAGRHVVSFEYNPYELRISTIMSIITSVFAVTAWLGLLVRNRCHKQGLIRTPRE